MVWVQPSIFLHVGCFLAESAWWHLSFFLRWKQHWASLSDLCTFRDALPADTYVLKILMFGALVIGAGTFQYYVSPLLPEAASVYVVGFPCSVSMLWLVAEKLTRPLLPVS